jgi:hypothetical protein
MQTKYEIEQLRQIALHFYVELTLKAKRKRLTDYELETLESAARLAG